MNATETLSSLKMVTEILALMLRAYETGRDVPHEALAAVFARADAAEREWEEANREAKGDG